MMSEFVIASLIIVGVLLSALSALGLIRFPDAYLRSHAASKSGTLGVLCILTGVFLFFALQTEHISVKLLLGILFVFLTSPVAGHLNGRAAYRSGVKMWKGSVRDDLGLALAKESKRNEERKNV